MSTSSGHSSSICVYYHKMQSWSTLFTKNGNLYGKAVLFIDPHRKKQIDFLQTAGCLCLGGLLFWVSCRYLFPWTAPFIFAMAFSTLIEPLICWCQRRLRFKRGFSSVIFTALLLFLLCGLLFLLVSQLLTEAYLFLQQFPLLIQSASEAIQHLQNALLNFRENLPPQARSMLQEFRFSIAGLPLFETLTQRLMDFAHSVASVLPSLGLFCITTVLAIFFISCHYPAVISFLRKQLPLSLQQKTAGLRSSITTTLLYWLKAQLLLFLITFCELFVGLSILKIEFSLLLAALIAVVDALPVFGTGTVLIPWSAVELLLGHSSQALGLFLLYVITLCVRNFLEPKLIASQVALPPIATLMAMYIGFSAFGLSGMILFPVLLLLLKQLHDSGYIMLWK